MLEVKSEVLRGRRDEEDAGGGGSQQNHLHGAIDETRRSPRLHDVIGKQRDRRANVHHTQNP
jgi:hypothetical protein